MLVEVVADSPSVGLTDDCEKPAVSSDPQSDVSRAIGRTVVQAGHILTSEAVAAALGEGGAGGGLKRLPSPLDMTPGCIPRNGVSKLMVAKIR